MTDLFLVGFVLHGLEAVVLIEAQRVAELIEERFGVDTDGILAEKNQAAFCGEAREFSERLVILTKVFGVIPALGMSGQTCPPPIAYLSSRILKDFS